MSLPIDGTIPALDEVASIGAVVRAVPRPPVRDIYVVDNVSRDGTAEAARLAGARVISEPRGGYGSACLAGIRALPADTAIILFLDGDSSDDPTHLPRLVEPIATGRADFVVRSRTEGTAEPGALTAQQRVGNAIAARWLRARFGLPAENALTGAGRIYDLLALPRVTFTDPQIASVGLTEAQARARGIEVKTATLQLKDVPRAIAARNTKGVIKLVAEDKSGKLLGAHILASEAGDVVQEATLAIRFGLRVGDLVQTFHPYLTMAEGLKLAAVTFKKDVKHLSCCAG